MKRTHMMDMNMAKPSTLLRMLIILSVLFVAAQVCLFTIHYQLSTMLDALIGSSIYADLWHAVILLPLLAYLTIQVAAYALFIGWIWFIAISVGELCGFYAKVSYCLGIILWFIAVIALLSLNLYFYPHSFFSQLVEPYGWFRHLAVLVVTVVIMVIATLLAFLQFFTDKNRLKFGYVLLVLMVFTALAYLYEQLISHQGKQAYTEKPNVILIGLDSVRPDYTSYFGRSDTKTPNIDGFLRSAVTLTQAYTPLARTFPAWMSILTAKYPLHHHARINMANPARIAMNDTLAKHMRALGYETIYGTDEPRFTDINAAYGFDRILGPRGGAVEFLIGSISDFPLSNMLLKLPMAQWLLPYQVGNRGIEVSYEPDDFLQLLKLGLAHQANKPVFLAIHLCLSHWPYSWARDKQPTDLSMPIQYRHGVEALDAQLGKLLALLQARGLLQHSIVVLLSDHGSGLGVRGDNLLDKAKYQGNQQQLNLIPVSRLSSAPKESLFFQRDYTINTSYGMGTDVTSPMQYHTLLAIKAYGMSMPPHHVNVRTSLIDIAPTLLDYLGAPALKQVDGISLKPYLLNVDEHAHPTRTFYFETGDKIAEIETDNIFIEKVVKRAIGAYRIDPSNGIVYLDDRVVDAMLKAKQRAVLEGDWLLAYYPSYAKNTLAPIPAHSDQFTLKTVMTEPYFILINLPTGHWTMDLSTAFAKSAPLTPLMQKLHGFYGKEMWG